ncbi:FK506-BINDING PROTEIN 4-LIKE [Salix viminalis]|uniref:FK506-BINDING PROTEIN 4-LIKE n=1 Tax=Salix viminalis TaxID=40686 RepID=A0A9Q0UGQ4_SALVM|nr:FK506-BINDING PROTEIN 4-LIKE [Salix viminalis]
MDMKGKKLTVIGTVDPVSVATKLRKYWPTDIITVGPAKEPEPEKKEAAVKEEPKKEEAAKKEEPKKEEAKAEEAKKEEPKKEEEKKEEKKKDPAAAAPPPPDPVLELVKAYRAYNPPMNTGRSESVGLIDLNLFLPPPSLRCRGPAELEFNSAKLEASMHFWLTISSHLKMLLSFENTTPVQVQQAPACSDAINFPIISCGKAACLCN